MVLREPGAPGRAIGHVNDDWLRPRCHGPTILARRAVIDRRDRFDTTRGVPARELLATLDADELAALFRRYAEEPSA